LESNVILAVLQLESPFSTLLSLPKYSPLISQINAEDGVEQDGKKIVLHPPRPPAIPKQVRDKHPPEGGDFSIDDFYM
jgi:hypothetical protein